MNEKATSREISSNNGSEGALVRIGASAAGTALIGGAIGGIFGPAASGVGATVGGIIGAVASLTDAIRTAQEK